MKAYTLDGTSMTPVLKPGDQLMINWECDDYSLGDIAAFLEADKSISIHRIIHKDPLVVKGDRNRIIDQRQQSIHGKVIGFYRDEKATIWGERGQLFKKVFAYLSKQSILEYETYIHLAKRYFFLKLIILLNTIEKVLGGFFYRNTTRINSKCHR